MLTDTYIFILSFCKHNDMVLGKWANIKLQKNQKVGCIFGENWLELMRESCLISNYTHNIQTVGCVSERTYSQLLYWKMAAF